MKNKEHCRKILQPSITRKAYLVIIALSISVLVIEFQPIRKWITEATSFVAPTITVLEFVVPKNKESN